MSVQPGIGSKSHSDTFNVTALGELAERKGIDVHILDDEMIPNVVVPGNAKESIWEIIKRC